MAALSPFAPMRFAIVVTERCVATFAERKATIDLLNIKLGNLEYDFRIGDWPVPLTIRNGAVAYYAKTMSSLSR